MKRKIKIWDLPTRLFHWMLAVSLVFMWYSAHQGGGMLLWHLRCGLLVLALVVFRLCWGLWGSDTARFVRFVRGPSVVWRYLLGKSAPDGHPGHNPLGAMMVVALLLAVSFQVATGLFASDTDMFMYSGYLNGLIGEQAGSALRKIHMRFFNLLLLLSAVHIVTIFCYRFCKKLDLIRPMITGFKEWEGRVPVLRFAGGWKTVTALAAALAAVFCVTALGRA